MAGIYKVCTHQFVLWHEVYYFHTFLYLISFSRLDKDRQYYVRYIMSESSVFRTRLSLGSSYVI